MESSLENSKRIIREFIQNVDGQPFDVCDNLFKMICAVDSSQQAALFQFVCELYGTVESSDKIPAEVSPFRPQKETLKEMYGDMVKSIIITFSQQNSAEIAFYQNLWRAITESILFDSDAKKTFAFYYVLNDERIPYFQIDNSLFYSMSNDRFSELQQKNIQERQKIRYIIKANFSQKTERASVLLDELGIGIPKGNEPSEIDKYENQLMKMVFILQENGKSDLSQILGQLRR